MESAVTLPREWNTLGSNFHAVRGNVLSGDGQRLAYLSWRECYRLNGPDSFCRYGGFNYLRTTVQDLKGNQIFQGEGRFRLSRNGRFLFLIPAAADSYGDPGALIDLSTGVAIAGGLNQVAEAVTDDGRIITQRGDIIDLRTGLLKRGFPGGELYAASPDGHTLIYSTGNALYARDASSGRDTLLFYDGRGVQVWRADPRVVELAMRSPGRARSQPLRISDDGRVVLALPVDLPEEPRQWLFTSNSDGSEPRWFGYVPEGYSDATLSGDGQIIYAITNTGRMVRADRSRDEVTEILPSTPQITGVPDALIPGSRNRIRGVQLPTTSGVRVTYNGQALPVFSQGPDEIVSQVGWETFIPAWDGRSDPYIIQLAVAMDDPASPFDSVGMLLGVSRGPLVAEDIPPVHADGTPIDAEHPVTAGESVRIYATGLGAVNPPVPTGEPAPGNPPSTLVSPITCLLGTSPAASPMFAGLAPGRIGVYEIQVKMPDLPVWRSLGSSIPVSCAFGISIRLPADPGT